MLRQGTHWVKPDGDNRYWFKDDELDAVQQDTAQADLGHRAGWMTEDALVARGHFTKDLTEMAACGILQTVAEGATRLYRIA